MRVCGTGVRAAAKTAWSAAAVAGLYGHAVAQAETADGATEVASVEVVGVAGPAAASAKYTAPLVDTPQTITVVSKDVIAAQNLMSLRDVLSTLPGITFGAGEGGGGYGDSINLRGYSASSDLAVDGVRDSAQYTRSDPFNIEQIEVVNGANGAYAGAGSVGGSINLSSKAPRGRDAATLSLGLGTDRYGRAALDANRVLNDQVAVRLNAMAHRNDVPGRQVEQSRRWGVAPAVTLGMMSPTTVTLSYFHQSDDNTPQYGVPYASNSVVNGPLPGVRRSAYYGYRNIDAQESDVDMATVVAEHRFSDRLQLHGLARWQTVGQHLVVDPPQGTWCLASGVNPQTGAACATPGVYAPSGPRGNYRDTDNTLAYGEAGVRAQFRTAGLAHTLVAGVAVTRETYRLSNGALLRQADGAAASLPAMSIAAPDTLYTGPVNAIAGGANAPSGTPLSFPAGGQRGERDNAALYFYDTIAVGPRFELNGGLRYEHNSGVNQSAYYTSYGYLPSGGPTPGAAQAGAPGGVFSGLGPSLRSQDDLVSYRLGAVFKPGPDASLYVAYGNSQTPSQSAVNGACSLTSCDVDPEKAFNVEIGGKWALNGGRLLLTAAIFRNERSAFRVDSGVPGVQQRLDGRSRVDGATLGASGVIRKGWAVFAGYTWLDSELLQSVADGLAGDFRAGDPLPNTPRHSANLWTTYDVTPQLQVGYGATYSGAYAFNRASAASALYQAPSYWVHSAAVTVKVNDRADLRLNIKNLTDKAYYTRIRSAGTAAIGGFGWATPGEARSATLTLDVRF